MRNVMDATTDRTALVPRPYTHSGNPPPSPGQGAGTG